MLVSFIYIECLHNMYPWAPYLAQLVDLILMNLQSSYLFIYLKDGQSIKEI